MPGASNGFSSTRLWRDSLAARRNDKDAAYRERLRAAFAAFREKAKLIAGEIGAQFPQYTVHDITHLDALWETASIIAGKGVTLNAAEGFTLGGAFLVHDLAMGAAAYAGGKSEFRSDLLYKDIISAVVRQRGGADAVEATEEEQLEADKVYLREMHAIKAEELPTQAWITRTGVQVSMIDNEELREYFGKMIGQIAASHWWPYAQVREELRSPVNSLPTLAEGWDVDVLKLASLMRVADAAHLDSRRAPAFLGLLRTIEGESATHWAFQERFGRIKLDGDRLRYSSSRPFNVSDADAWWLAYDTIRMVDGELRAVDNAFSVDKRVQFAAKGVLGADDAQSFSRYVQVDGWYPIDARPVIHDVPGVIERLGGAALYGGSRRGAIVIRELLQNAVDASKALAILQPKAAPKAINLDVSRVDGGLNIRVTDFGVGMSENAVTRGLLDFGTSLWSSAALRRELPGLLSGGFEPSGKYGIGFFSVFMLTSRVRVRTKRYKAGSSETLVIEFRDGLKSRPIVRKALEQECLWKESTVVELFGCPEAVKEYSILRESSTEAASQPDETYVFNSLCEYSAPFCGLDLCVTVDGVTSIITAIDPLTDLPELVLRRARGPRVDFDYDVDDRLYPSLLREVRDDRGRTLGRACVSSPWRYGYRGQGAVIARNGIRIADLLFVQGFFFGTPLKAARDSAKVDASISALTVWANEQVDLILSNAKYDERERVDWAELALSLGADAKSLPIAETVGVWLNEDGVREWSRERNVILLLEPGYEDEGEYLEDIELGDDILVTSSRTSMGSELIDAAPSYTVTASERSRRTMPSDFVLRAVADGWGMSIAELKQTSCCLDCKRGERYTAYIGTYIESETAARRRIQNVFARNGADVSDLDLRKVEDF